MFWSVKTISHPRYIPTCIASYPVGRYGIEFHGQAPDRTKPGMNAIGRGERLSGQGLPYRFWISSLHKHLPDLIHDKWLVSEAFRDLVAAREPDVHQFFPVEMLLRNREPAAKSYYILNVIQTIRLIKTASGLALDAETAFGKHLARAATSGVDGRPWTIRSETIFSDELKAAVERAKLRRLEYMPRALAEPGSEQPTSAQTTAATS